MDALHRLFRGSPTRGRIAFNMRLVEHPWGGGNQWLDQLGRRLRADGYEVRHDLRRSPDRVVLVDPRVGGTVSFGANDIAALKDRDGAVRCLHRINECDLRKGTNEIDELLADANPVADHTVFISSWLRDYHAGRWFDVSRPHSVILNGADPEVFHPRGSAELEPGGTMRLVTHHWSANPLKGFDVYRQVDRLIADGDLADVELWVIGRWPEDYRWRSARTFAPVTGPPLADLLRQCHVYLTASRWEPGGMHHVEGAQCGLPVLYHEDGGGIVELASRYGIGFREDVAGAIVNMRERYGDLRRRVLEQPPSGDAMCAAYAELIEGLLVR